MSKQLTFLTRGRNASKTEAVVLTETQINHYNEYGYVIPEYRLPSEQVEAIKAQYSRLIEADQEFSDYCPSLLIHDTGFLNFARKLTNKKLIILILFSTSFYVLSILKTII